MKKILINISINELTGSILKLLGEEEKKQIIEQLELNENDIVFIVAGNKKIVKPSPDLTRRAVSPAPLRTLTHLTAQSLSEWT